jgi:succinate dehydrogenase flavin-adding protein (antitoxin of CptAB toxin-antitoxin module)
MLRGGGGAHFAAPHASSHGSVRAHGNGYVQRSGGSHHRVHNAASSHSRSARGEHRASHRQAVHQRQHKHTVARAQTKHDRAVAAREARQNRVQRANLLRQARQGRFAARFYRKPPRFYHVAHRPYWWAWNRGWYAGFVPWYGWLWWPYAYADIFAFTFWPWGYDPGYWYYAYDDFFDGVYYGDTGPGSAYASAESGSTRSASRKASTSDLAQLCKQPDQGLTAWPTAEINSKLNLNDEQKALFEDLQAAGKQAADVFAQSCPQDPNLAATPTGRLEMMTVRLDATLRSVEIVKPALNKFYASLSDEQKQRFNEMGPKNKAMVASRQRRETQGSAGHDTADACKDPKPGLTNLPITQIQDRVHPSEAQQANLKELEDANTQAVSILQNACPDEVPMTPPGRLDAMETRLRAMLEAANTIKPSLDRFYQSLNDEQKARFNGLSRQLASND